MTDKLRRKEDGERRRRRVVVGALYLAYAAFLVHRVRCAGDRCALGVWRRDMVVARLERACPRAEVRVS